MYYDDEDENLSNPYARDDDLTDDFPDAGTGPAGFPAGQRPERVRKWVDDTEQDAPPRWTTRRIILIVVTLLLVASLLMWDILPLLDVAIMPDAITRPTPTAMPGA